MGNRSKLSAAEQARRDQELLQELLGKYEIATRVADGILQFADGTPIRVGAHENPNKAARRIRDERALSDVMDLARQLAAEAPGVAVARQGATLHFRLDDQTVATISASVAEIRGGPKLDRSQASVPEITELLRTGLRDAAFARPTRRVGIIRASQHDGEVYLRLPPKFSTRAKDAALEASNRLRTSRNFDPAFAVEMSTHLGLFRFEPVRPRNPLEAKFRLERGPDYFVGGLRLRTPRDLLALNVHEYGSGRLFADAWAGALILYAHLTCVDAPVSSGESVRASIRGSQADNYRGPADAVYRPIRHAATKDTVEYSTLSEVHRGLQSVSGHMRRLAGDGQAGKEALHVAETLGIQLPDGCTWVRAHQRGPNLVRLLSSGVPTLW